MMHETKGQRVERLRGCAREELRTMIKIGRWLERPGVDVATLRAELLEIAEAAADLLEAERGRNAPLADRMVLDNDEPAGESWLEPDESQPIAVGAR